MKTRLLVFAILLAVVIALRISQKPETNPYMPRAWEGDEDEFYALQPEFDLLGALWTENINDQNQLAVEYRTADSLCIVRGIAANEPERRMLYRSWIAEKEVLMQERHKIVARRKAITDRQNYLLRHIQYEEPEYLYH
jgi:hypothetical protein